MCSGSPGVRRLAGTGVEPDIRGDGNPAGEIDRQYVDSSKIRALVGWEPSVDLAEGLRRTIEWYRKHPEARAPGPKKFLKAQKIARIPPPRAE